MSYTDYDDPRTPEQREHDFFHTYRQGSVESIFVNLEDINSKMWSAVYDVFLDDRSYMVAADCESDALDEVIDWLEWNAPVYLFEEIAYRHEAVTPEIAQSDDNLHAGNFGYILRDEIVEAIAISQYRKRPTALKA